MNRYLKIILTITSTLIFFIILDTIQAKILNRSPLIKTTENYNGGTLYQINKGIIVDNYICTNKNKKTVFKWQKYSCPSNTEINNNHQQKISWEEITSEGINEELLLKNIDQKILTKVSKELQELVSEAINEEKENPEILITEGWARVLNYDRFKTVLNIGTPAMKPLYLIIYKSPNRGEYEYLCAYALYQLSGFDFEWSTTDEFIEKFNSQIIKEK